MRAALFSFLVLVTGVHASVSPEDFVDTAESGNLEQIGKLLDEGADPNSTNHSGATALHFAAWNENIPLIELLLSRGGTPSLHIREKHHDGTPLEWVTFKGRPAIVKLLLDRGSKVYDLDWSIAMKFAAQGPPPFLKETKKEDYALILQHFKDAGFTDRQDLFSACARGDTGLAKRLIEQDPNCIHVETQAGDEFGEGVTPLLYAATTASRGILKLLLESGASPTAKDKDGNTVLHLAAAAGAWENLVLLLDHDAAIDAQNTSGKTALELAVRNRRWLATEILMLRGATITEAARAESKSPAVIGALSGNLPKLQLKPRSE